MYRPEQKAGRGQCDGCCVRESGWFQWKGYGRRNVCGTGSNSRVSWEVSLDARRIRLHDSNLHRVIWICAVVLEVFLFETTAVDCSPSSWTPDCGLVTGHGYPTPVALTMLTLRNVTGGR